MVDWAALANNYKRLIIEGADGSGKSTLVQTLKQYRMDPEDRSFITDVVYRLEDGKNPWSYVNIEDMAKVLNRCIIVYCKNPNCFEISMQRGEDNITSKKRSKKIQTIYEYVMTFIRKYTRATVFEYNWQKDDVNELIKNIKEVL